MAFGISAAYSCSMLSGRWLRERWEDTAMLRVGVVALVLAVGPFVVDEVLEAHIYDDNYDQLADTVLRICKVAAVTLTCLAASDIYHIAQRPVDTPSAP